MSRSRVKFTTVECTAVDLVYLSKKNACATLIHLSVCVHVYQQGPHCCIDGVT